MGGVIFWLEMGVKKRIDEGSDRKKIIELSIYKEVRGCI